MTSLTPTTAPQSVFDQPHVSIARLLIVSPQGETILGRGEPYDWDRLLVDFLLQSRNDEGDTPTIIAVMQYTGDQGGYPMVHHYGVPSLDKGRQIGERLVSVQVYYCFSDGGSVLRGDDSRHLPNAIKLTRVLLAIDTIIDGAGEVIRQRRISDLVASVVLDLTSFTLKVLDEEAT